MACAILTPVTFAGSLYLRPEWAATVGCLVALFLGVPLTILFYVDFVRARAAASPTVTRSTRALAAPIALFGLISLAIGLALIGWVLYNVFVERMPSYRSDTWLPSFGIGPLLVLFGWRQLRRPFSR
jgi:hypothetical protein